MLDGSLSNFILFRLELNMELCNIVNQESLKTSPAAFDAFDLQRYTYMYTCNVFILFNSIYSKAIKPWSVEMLWNIVGTQLTCDLI